MSFLYVKWNRFALWSLADVPPLEHVWCFHGHSQNGGLRRRRRRAQAVVEGAAIALTGVSQSDDCCGSHLDNQ